MKKILLRPSCAQVAPWARFRWRRHSVSVRNRGGNGGQEWLDISSRRWLRWRDGTQRRKKKAKAFLHWDKHFQLPWGLFLLQSLRIWLQIYYIIIHNYSVVFFDKTLLFPLFKQHTLIKRVKTFKKYLKERKRKSNPNRNCQYQMQRCETCSHRHSKPQQPCGVHTTHPASFYTQSNSARWWRGGLLWLNLLNGKLHC